MKILRIIITKEGYESRKTLFYILVWRGIDDEMKKRDNVYRGKNWPLFLPQTFFCVCIFYNDDLHVTLCQNNLTKSNIFSKYTEAEHTVLRCFHKIND